MATYLGVVGRLDLDGSRFVVCARCAAVDPLPGTLTTGALEAVEESHCDDCGAALDGADEDEDADDCPECARSFGPHYRGPCPHGGRLFAVAVDRLELNT